jgi:hypothetical protein
MNGTNTGVSQGHCCHLIAQPHLESAYNLTVITNTMEAIDAVLEALQLRQLKPLQQVPKERESVRCRQLDTT